MKRHESRKSAEKPEIRSWRRAWDLGPHPTWLWKKTASDAQKQGGGFRVIAVEAISTGRKENFLVPGPCGCYRLRGCAEAGPARSVCLKDSRGIGAAHHRRWAAEASSLGEFRV